MNLFDLIAEQRILEAQSRGEFDDLPGQGQPLALEDDALVPEELRVAYRVLKNAGFIPPEVQQLKDIRELERFITETPDDAERTRALRKLRALTLARESARGRRGAWNLDVRYHERVVSRLA
jgi:hypothetical protein